MRNPNRIPICLKLLFQNKIIYQFLNTKTSGYAKILHENWDLIEETWNEYPDLRFGQLLCNLRLIPDLTIENHIWNIEEDEWLIRNGYCKIEDVKFWGVLYYKNGNKRKKVKHVLLKDLKTDHIKNIIKFFENYNAVGQLNLKYLEYFNKRIELNE